MISELTETQKQQLKEFKKQAFAIGSSTEPADYTRAKKAIFKLYELIKKPPPKYVFCAPPKSCVLAINYLSNQTRFSGDEFEKIENNVFTDSLAHLRDLNKRLKVTTTYTNLWGQMDYYWVAFYRFPMEYIDNNIYREKDKTTLGHWTEISESCGWWWPYTNWLFIADRPSEVHWNNAANPVLHKDSSAACKFRDGHEIFALNGVIMPKEYVIFPAEKIDIKKGLQEKNVEVRSQIIKKVGLDLLYAKLNPTILDKEDEYEVLSFNFGVEAPDCRYLRMKNPSVPLLYHIEGVPDDTKTVDEALQKRKPSALQNVPIDNQNGEDWYLQGDVAIWPKNAKSLKNRPTIIT